METRGTIRLRDEAGRLVPFDYLTDIKYNHNSYAVMLPLTGEEYVYIFLIKPGSGETDADRYQPVEDRAALEAVFERFKEQYKGEFTFQ